MENLLCGIDLGGTKIEIALLNQAFEVIERSRVPTESVKGYQHIINQIHLLIKQTEKKHEVNIKAIGLGTPGAVDPDTGLVKNSNTTCLNGKKLIEDLEAQIGKSFVCANDANCFAIAETLMGVVPDHLVNPKLVFGVIMGTGVGGGLVINNEVHHGLHAIGGEWGHNHLDDSGGNCYCGKLGCIETIISGPALERYYQALANEHLHLKEIIKQAREGENDNAVKTLHRLTFFFGKAISSLINILDPEAIVLGGGLGNIDELYTDGFKHAKEFAFNPDLKTKFLKPKLGDSAGVFGAALLTQNIES